MANLASPVIGPSSDKLLWTTLHNRVESILETRKSKIPSSNCANIDGESSRVKRMKEDSMLLIKGFDSIASTLSQLTGSLDNALQGGRDLAKSSALTEIVPSSITNRNKSEDGNSEESEIVDEKKGVKRKLDECCSTDEKDETEKQSKYQAEKNLKKVKNLAVCMATKASSLARELKSVKSDMCFLQDRCVLLEEENRRLRQGFGDCVPLEEDDLVRLQLEALLAEKSRLATENANMKRENQSLRELVEYHQFATQDLSASYEQVIEGLCLDFSSPCDEDRSNHEDEPQTPKSGDLDFHSALHKKFVEEEEEEEDDLVNHESLSTPR